MKLIHITDRSRLDSIRAEGLRPLTYFSNPETHRVVGDYYRDVIDEDGPNAESVAIAVEFEGNEEGLEPDYPGIEEPLSHALGMSEHAIREAWAASDQDVHASLRIVGSCRCLKAIPPERIDFDYDLEESVVFPGMG